MDERMIPFHILGDALVEATRRLMKSDPAGISPDEAHRMCSRALAIAALKALPSPTEEQIGLLRRAIADG